jgi:hypothetical protein
MFVLHRLRAEQPDQAFQQAFREVFTLKNGAYAIELNTQCTSRMRSLMIRSNIPTNEHDLRNMTEVDMIKLGMLAAVANMSPWQRDENGSGLIVMDYDGKLNPEHEVNSMESNIMMCIVCALLATIGAIHIINMRPV